MLQAIKNKYITLYALLLITVHSSAQADAGKILTYKSTHRGIEGKTTTGIFDVHAYNDHTVRVRISKNKTFNPLPYVTISSPDIVNKVSIADKGRTIEIVTASITTVIEKEPSFRVIFKNNKGEIINEDVAGKGFSTSFIGDKFSLYKKIQDGERFVGLGEVLGSLDKRGMGFTLNNTDTYKYGDPRLSMYASIPFYIGIHHQTQYGIFLNNSFKSFFNFGLSTPFTSITAEGGDADYFFFYDQSVAKIVEHYTTVTGRMPLPPKWSLGYHQSRCSYFPQSQVEWLAETFRKKQIPIDGIVLDADYQLNYQPFRTDKDRFPDMPGLAKKLSGMNIQLTASVYPGVKIDSSYESYIDGLKKDVFIKYTDGSLFKTEIAPLKILLPDYTNPVTRNWWIGKMKWMKENGISGYWNDMNEPAVGGSYLPDNLQFDFDGRKANATEAKNIYGFQMARSSYEAGLQYLDGKRPFVLSRSAFAGIQRYAAVWSGDNTASDEGLLSGVLLNSQLSISGIPFVGPDLGGYIGDGTKDLFKRWMEVGIFSPYVRNHKEAFATANEPWSYGEEAEAISKAYIGFRYRLLPYIYSAFYEASKTGMPVARSLCIYYPYDDKVYDNIYQYQFLFGDALMVAPVTSKETIKKVYLPKGEWYDLFSEELHTGNNEIEKQTPIFQLPVFVKASAIIPMQSQVQSTMDKASDTLFLHVYNGKEKNNYIFYEDEGEGFAYQQTGFARRYIEFDPLTRQIHFSKQEGNYTSGFKKIQLILHGFDGVQSAVINNQQHMLSATSVRLLDVLNQLKDCYYKDYYESLKATEPVLSQKTITIDNQSSPITLQLQ